MKIPPTLKVGGQTIQVVYKRYTDETYGEFENVTNTIYINEALPLSQQGATLIHELLGAMNPTLHEDGLPHILLESLSAQLYQVLADNPLCFHTAKQNG